MLFVFSLSCGIDGSNKSIPKKAKLKITFEPNPVVQSKDGKWHYKVFIKEINGIGLDISVFRVASYAPNEEFISEYTYVNDEFSDWFTECGGEGNHMPDGDIRCSDFESWGISGFRDWTFLARMI